MATTTERPYTSDGEVWAVFVGEITAEEFIKPFLGSPDPVDAAIKNVISNWVWDEEPPTWLPSVLYRYVSEQFKQSIIERIDMWRKYFA